jgi:hypothetical protein
VLLLVRCANPVTPEGGPKDTKPPKVIFSDPPNFSIRFADNSVRVGFDEYVNLKNQATEVFVSPRLKEPPDLKIRGKDIVIKLDDSLAPATTYSITFGKAIADVNENNVLEGFTYVFSTGEYIDSLTIRGRVISAFDRQPAKDLFVLLYIDNNDTIPFDSLPVKVPPYYVTKTNSEGSFTFSNIRNSPVKIIALGDLNSDLIFNQPTEKIAFLDSTLHPVFIPVPVADSVKKDTTPAPPSAGDSLRARLNDSTVKTDTARPGSKPGQEYTLMLFEETDSVQRILKSGLVREGMLLITFRYPARAIALTPLNFDTVPAPWWQEEYSAGNDSLTLWLRKGLPDSLFARVSVNDSILDTLRIDLKKKELKKKSDKGAREGEVLTMISSAQSGILNQYKTGLVLTFAYPLAKYDFSGFRLIEGKDTLRPEIVFSDSLRRKLLLKHAWKEDEKYQLFLPDSLLFGINGLTNDSIAQPFRTMAARELGNLVVSVTFKPECQYVIQVLNEKENVIYAQKVLKEPGPVKFEYLAPGKFKIKAIKDRNNNGKWDTGNYRKKLQPEEVYYLSKALEIRANWDVEEPWNLE